MVKQTIASPDGSIKDPVRLAKRLHGHKQTVVEKPYYDSSDIVTFNCWTSQLDCKPDKNTLYAV